MLSEGTLPLNFKTIDYYQWKYPGIQSKLIYEKYIKCFCGVQNPITLVTYKDKSVIPHTLQIYVVVRNHKNILHHGLYCTDVMISNIYKLQ